MQRRSVSNAGVVLGLVSAAAFGTSGSFAASLIQSGWSPGAAVTARVVIAATLLTIPGVIDVWRHHIAKRAAPTVLLYGVVAVAGAQLCYFNAVARMSVAVALLIEYSGILLVVAWGWARHGHRPRRLTFIAGAAALAGLVLVLDLVGSQRVDPIGVTWALGAAVGLAVYFVVASHTDDAPSPLTVAWGGLVIGAALLGIAIAAGVVPVHATASDAMLAGRQTSWVIPVGGMAVIAGVVAYLTGIAAARRLGAKLASFLGLTEVLFAVLFAWLLLGQQLEPLQLAGGVLVVGGIAVVRFDEMREPARPDSGDTRAALNPVPSHAHTAEVHT
ncbi:MAG: DMT family transporter [Candidatus Dormibacteria bacterium]